MKLFQRTQRSLFGEILDWMLTPLLLLWPISLALTWLVAQNLANKPFDRALVYNVQALAQFIQVAPGGRARFSLPQPASELLRADDADIVYYQVLGARGELLSGERDLPAPPSEFEPETDMNEVPALRDAEFRGLPMRMAWVWVPIEGARAPALVQVAETREKRSVLAAEIIKGVMLPQFAILPLAVLLVWLALVRGIKPLSELEARIRARRPDDLSPLDEHAVPQEVGPLVSSVNGLLTRLKDSIATQKRFLADAAHQLKTPLAGLRMQADLAQRQDADAEDLKQSLQLIGLASMRATHTVNQLLAMARAESGGAALAHQPCDIVQLILEVVREAVPRAMDHQIDLGYEGPEPGSPELSRHGNPTLLKEMIRNLVDNAVNYTSSTPERPGVVTVRVRSDPFSHALAVQVEDNGPGVPAAERGRIFEPFYRALGTNVDGTGLGLPIVQEIARQHGAEVTVDDAHPGQQPPGALFTLRFAR
ncbi:MAG: sensor histidine kinase N-terminal domain-containing protein [Proteobacteria bacterium]|jgi:two-component system sensor histidine kinase TctE|nr:sensor histidine kinase N-terminal domain-containing protein [Pseudomonadota bacterium]